MSKRTSQLIRDIPWIFYISRRFARVENDGKFAASSVMPSVGIGFGVAALIVIISVMNGFQMGSIESIMEISSYHIRAVPSDSFNYDELVKAASSNSHVVSMTPFFESQALLTGSYGTQSASLIRAVPENILEIDEGFRRETVMYSGRFDLNIPDGIILGYTLARSLGASVGDTVNILALSGGSDVELFSDNREFTVTGIFSCGYAEINSAYSFISYQAGKRIFGSSAVPTYGFKLNDSRYDSAVMTSLQKNVSGASFESWRTFNRSFFGALRIEKNILMLLVFLIFVVVGVNIFNGMRRMVYEKREEICVLSALGGRPLSIQSVFIVRGLLIGISGAVPGLIIGLLLGVRIDAVFTMLSSVMYNIQYFFTMLVNPAAASSVRQNMTYLFYAQIPARVYFTETAAITLFGIFSALFAAWTASRKTLQLSAAEVLRDE